MTIPQSEAIERAALEDLHRAAPPRVAAALGLQGVTHGSAFVSLAAASPTSAIVINRTIGLGLAESATGETVRLAAEEYRRASVPRYFVHLHPDARPADLPRILERNGLGAARGWQKFSRGREAVPIRETDLKIRKVGRKHGAAFGEIVSSAFDLGSAAAPLLAELPGRDGWHIIMSFDNNEAAGTGAMFVQDNLAWLDYGATLPKFRRRGSQGAVLAARLQLALDLGCRKMFTCTGVAVAGEPQHSYGNILKMGFQKSYVRDNFAPEM